LFFVPALAPVVYNVGIIIGIIFLTPSLGLFAPVVGVGIGALLFLCIQIPVLIKIGYRHSWNVNPRTPGVTEVVRLMVPRTIGIAISQIDTTVDLALSSLLGARMITVFQFAQNLQQLPIGLFGATIAQAALPALSQASVKDDKQQFISSLVSAIHQMLFFILPTSIVFIVLRIPIVRLVFGASRFDWEATLLTGMTLSAFSISLFAQAVSQLLTRGFYALYDSKTPVIVGVCTIFTNTLLSILFIQRLHLPVWSLGLSTSIASIGNVFLLFIFLDKKVGGFEKRALYIPVIKMVIASLTTGLALYLPLKLFDQLVFDTTRVFGLLLLVSTAFTIGASVYLFLSWVLGITQIQHVTAFISRLRKPRTVLLEPASEVVNGEQEILP
jgi:putative peptidoglycan lipid II flippase